MKTDDLITTIVQDRSSQGASLTLRMTAALVAGGAVSAALFALSLGVRPDVSGALQTWRFLLKLAIALVGFAVALWTSARLARPDANVRSVLTGLAIMPALLSGAVGLELLTVPPEAWVASAVGSNAHICLTAIPLLSIAPLAALLTALSAGAPRSPWAAGAVAGLLAGSLAAALYATHCVDDSPLFVAVWYTLAVAAVMLAGAIAGQRVMRW